MLFAESLGDERGGLGSANDLNFICVGGCSWFFFVVYFGREVPKHEKLNKIGRNSAEMQQK